MKYVSTNLKDCCVLELDEKTDHRGFFARVFCENEFKERNLHTQFVQFNTSLSLKKGTIRGFHLQNEPYGEVKLVKCIRGALWDVVIDLRKNSNTYLKHFAVELSADNRKMLYIPAGFAHAFQTLQDQTEALYFVSEFFKPEAEQGVRYNDPYFNIQWPIQTEIIVSDKDSAIADFKV